MAVNFPIIDVHSHILPGIDDGSRTMEESLGLLEMAAEQGITAAIATPHCPRRGQIPRTQELFKELEERCADRLEGFGLYSGHETFYHEALLEQLREGLAHTLAGSKFVLVEFRPDVPYAGLYRGLRSLSSGGYVPVLAHMERYGCLRQEKNLEDVMGCGCWLQMNYDSLQGSFLKPDVRWCRRQVLEGRIRLFGTDMHRLDFRPPRIRKALEWLDGHVDRSDLKRMLYENPLRIIQ